MHTLINSGDRMIDVWKRNYQPVTFYFRSFETIVLYLKSLPAAAKTPTFLNHLWHNLEMSPSFNELRERSNYEQMMFSKIDQMVAGSQQEPQGDKGMVQIYTVQISKAKQTGLIDDPRFLDTTVKSGDKVFAPTWKMVMGVKEGKISKEEYTQEYYEMMRKSYRINRQRWDEVLGMEEVILGCYCRAEEFCHRDLLRDMLVKCGGVDGVDNKMSQG